MHGPMTRPTSSGFAQWHAKSLIAPVGDTLIVGRTMIALREKLTAIRGECLHVTSARASRDHAVEGIGRYV